MRKEQLRAEGEGDKGTVNKQKQDREECGSGVRVGTLIKLR